KYFNALTGIRAIAAFMVYLHHYNPIPKEYAMHYLINEMHIGVTLFFVLSGFLIAYRYLDLKSFSFRNYIVNRIARIYPMYFLLTTLKFAVVLYSRFDIKNLIIYGLNITMLRGFFESFKYTGISQGWSLTVEETFYFLAPIFFILIKRNKINLILLPIFLISIGIGLVLIFSKITFFGFFSSFDFMFNYTFFGRCTEFFIGISLAIVYKYNMLKNFRYLTYTGIVGILISLILLTTLKGDFDFGIRHPIGKLINTLILPLFGIFTLYYGLLKENTIISKILSSKLFVLLGKSSYIFYLIHMGIFISLLNKFGLTGSIISNSVKFIILNIISIILYKYIEEPLNIIIRRYNAGRQQAFGKKAGSVLK
ncbi:MAG: acyltransferase family protein, partial [Sediminibacterium sp.]